MKKETSGKDTNLHTENLQNWGRGDRLTAKHLDQPVKFLKQSFNGVRQARQVSGKQGANFFVKRMLVVSVEDNYLLCKLDDDPDSTDEIQVALPPEFRKQIYDFTENDGKTRTLVNDRENKYEYLNTQKRKAIAQTGEADEADEDTEVQVIVPAYIEDDIIFAMQGIVGGTGATQEINGEDVPIKWQDMNVSGRAWAKADDQDDET